MPDNPAGDTASGPSGFTTSMPTTPLGKWSMWMAVAFAIGWVFNLGLVGVVGTSQDAALNEFSRTYLPYWGIALLSLGAIAGGLGLVALLKQKERSIVTLITLAPAVLVLTLVIGELVFPH